MKSKLILCLFIICLLVSSLGIVSAYNLEHEVTYENGTIHRYFIKWDNKSFDEPVRVDVSFFQSNPELNALGVNISWQRAANDAIKDINNMGNRSGSRANFAFENNFREAEVIMTAYSFTETVNGNLTLTNDPLAKTNYTLYYYHPENRTYASEKSRIEFNTNVLWGIPGLAGVSWDLEATMAHELGHAAGLDHHSERNSVMRPILIKGEHRRWDTDDVDGLIAIYGERRETQDEGTPAEETHRNISERLNNIKESAKITDSIVVRENINGVETITVQEQTRAKIVSATIESIEGTIEGFFRWVGRLW